MQGASPLVPGAGRDAALVRRAWAAPGGGLPGWSSVLPAVPAPGGGLAVFVACLPCLLLAFLPPSPHPLPRRGRGRFLLSYARGFAPCIPRGWRGAALVRRALAAPGGGLPGSRRITLPFRCPAGGLPSLSPVYPAFCLLSCPHPPSPLPNGKGEIFVILLQGASPLASPGLAGRGTGSAGVGGTRRGAFPVGRRFCLPFRHPAGTCFLGRLSTLPFAYFPAPIPPPPSPAGRGRFLLFYCKGLRPLHPPGLAGRGTG